MGRLRNIIKRITNPFLKKGFQFYNRKPRLYQHENIKVILHPNVFPPRLTFSTKILLDFIKPLDLKNKSLLELGCGSGIISLYASQKGANVTATDINKTALEYLDKNANTNGIELEIIYSNLFENVTKTDFDYIIINPPYYPKKPTSIKEQAWFCGENFEYFIDLFNQLSKRGDITVLMILSQDCDVKHITSIANKNQMNMKLIKTIKKISESNYIFEISKID